MTDTEVLCELIRDDARIPLDGAATQPRIVLTEPNAPDSSASIAGLPQDAIVLKADMLPAPTGIFNGSKGECKRADFIIISERKKVILHIEMKLGRANNGDVVKQLKGSHCYASYCASIGKIFWDENDFLRDYEHRYVSLRHTSISKKKTGIKREQHQNIAPDRALKISNPKNLQYLDLIN